MKQYEVTPVTNFYRLQPGDETRYEFFITQPSNPQNGYWEDEMNTGMAKDNQVISGLEPGFVLIGIDMPGRQGMYPTSKAKLKDLQKHHVMYMSGHMGRLNPYTVAAVLLAVGVLVENPYDLLVAAKAMLRAPEILAQLYWHNNSPV